MSARLISLDEALARRGELQPSPPTADALLEDPRWPDALHPTGAPDRAPIGVLGAIRVDALHRGYWQYVRRTVLLLEIDGLTLIHRAVEAADEHPRTLVGLVGLVPARSDLAVDLTGAAHAGLAEAPLEAFPVLDLLTRHESGADDLANLATVEGHTPREPARWPGEEALAPPFVERICRTFRRDPWIPGYLDSWRELTCATRLRVGEVGWSFERVPVRIAGRRGAPMT